jgi:hypothetical protein
MPIFQVRFTVMGQGLVEVDAENEEHAENLVTGMTTEDLLAETDFSDGLVVDDVERAE